MALIDEELVVRIYGLINRAPPWESKAQTTLDERLAFVPILSIYIFTFFILTSFFKKLYIYTSYTT